ncbi:hypothetical protein [Leptolyngbya sp. FACHB-711]|uniref:hypothetical protein n=1 Tax=unclassified Leptolyngbya TaxID=2650499 RepID=UPI0016874CB4|nr:hypothetical protein [Leptolyngbya sp. FACHB-711]MBD1851571.1 hypothetical protein [Cyanobacteria bacterium FACHB-502]MBD2026695.1 hypothetical protein [Leptolyngbya sp. FACHB-711]
MSDWLDLAKQFPLRVIGQEFDRPSIALNAQKTAILFLKCHALLCNGLGRMVWAVALQVSLQNDRRNPSI